MNSARTATDEAMMARCIELSRIAATKGEYPFGTVIALDGQVVAEAITRVTRDGDEADIPYRLKGEWVG
jgi:tRNA(adenine34) deaminase